MPNFFFLSARTMEIIGKPLGFERFYKNVGTFAIEGKTKKKEKGNVFGL